MRVLMAVDRAGHRLDEGSGEGVDGDGAKRRAGDGERSLAQDALLSGEHERASGEGAHAPSRTRGGSLKSVTACEGGSASGGGAERRRRDARL